MACVGKEGGVHFKGAESKKNDACGARGKGPKIDACGARQGERVPLARRQGVFFARFAVAKFYLLVRLTTKKPVIH